MHFEWIGESGYKYAVKVIPGFGNLNLVQGTKSGKTKIIWSNLWNFAHPDRTLVQSDIFNENGEIKDAHIVLLLIEKQMDEAHGVQVNLAKQRSHSVLDHFFKLLDQSQLSYLLDKSVPEVKETITLGGKYSAD